MIEYVYTRKQSWTQEKAVYKCKKDIICRYEGFKKGSYVTVYQDEDSVLRITDFAIVSKLASKTNFFDYYIPLFSDEIVPQIDDNNYEEYFEKAVEVNSKIETIKRENNVCINICDAVLTFILVIGSVLDFLFAPNLIAGIGIAFCVFVTAILLTLLLIDIFVKRIKKEWKQLYELVDKERGKWYAIYEKKK